MSPRSSTLFATVFLMGLAVAGAVITYAWVQGLAQREGMQIQASIGIEEVLFGNSTSGGGFAVKVSVRNKGYVPVVIEEICLMKGEAQFIRITGMNYRVPEGRLAAISIEEDASSAFGDYCPGLGVEPDLRIQEYYGTGLDPGFSYMVKIVTKDGLVAEGVYVSPAVFKPV